MFSELPLYKNSCGATQNTHKNAYSCYIADILQVTQFNKHKYKYK